MNEREVVDGNETLWRLTKTREKVEQTDGGLVSGGGVSFMKNDSCETEMHQ